MAILEIPSGIKMHELANSIVWMDKGILFSKPKVQKLVNTSREQIIEDMQTIKTITEGQKINVIIQSHPSSASPSKEDTDLIAEEMSKVVKELP